MAHEGCEKLPILRITFRELEERCKLMETANGGSTPPSRDVLGDEYLNLQSCEAIGSPGDGGIFHISPTVPGSSLVSLREEKNSRRTSHHTNISPSRGVVTTGKATQSTQAQARNLGANFSNSSLQDSRSKLGNDPVNIPPLRAHFHLKGNTTSEVVRRHEGSHPNSLSEGQSQRKKDCGRLKQAELIDEWKRYYNKERERALFQWSGDVTELYPFLNTCQKMQKCAEKVLTQDLELFSKLDISSKLWKIGHYQLIETLRRRSDAKSKEILEKFLTSSIKFYTQLINIVQSKFSFQLSELVNNQIEFTSRTRHRMVMVAAVVSHTWYIYLGDLTRYWLQSLGREADWSKPKQYYLKAHQLAPKDGKPYNQLAVISINMHQRFDAVYYYMRSLATIPPFQSAYDSLVGIFADTSRKAERLAKDEKIAREREAAKALRKQRKAERLRNKKSRKQNLDGGKEERRKGGAVVQEFSSGRKEIWIMPGVSSVPWQASPDTVPLCDQEGEQKDVSVDLSQISLPQVVKKTTSAFLLVHGKLFTRTDVESLESSVRKMLQYLDGLVKGELRSEYAMLFLKMMVINLFSIHNSANNFQGEELTMMYYCGLSLDLTLRVVIALLEGCVKSLHTLVPPEEAKTVSEEVGTVCEGAKIVCEDVDEEVETVSEWVKTLEIPKDEKDDHGSGVVALEGANSTDSINSVPLPVSVEVLDCLSVLLPAVRIVFDWFLCQKELYSKCLQTIKETLLHDFWTTTVNFLNASSCVLTGYSFTDLRQDVTSNSPKLWEDRVLAGFMPLKASLSTKDTFSIPIFRKMTKEQHREQTVARVAIITSFCHFLCKEAATDEGRAVPRAPIKYNSQSNMFSMDFQGIIQNCEDKGEINSSGVEELDESLDLETEDRNLSFGLSDSDDVIEEPSEGEDEGAMGGVMSESKVLEVEELEGGKEGIAKHQDEQLHDKDSEIEQLKAKRDGLARKIEERKLAIAVTKNVLSEATGKATEEIHIIPKYLVPDTNCFVDMLPSIQSLIKRTDFVIAVPLIVIAELEGLSKGSSNAADEKHNTSRASTGARNALKYISNSFEAKVPYLKALTTQGSLLSTLSFRAEITGKASNDDLILESSLQLHLKNQAAGGNCYKVVLLTDDRNLRVKAHANGQPVKDIPNFMKLLS